MMNKAIILILVCSLPAFTSCKKKYACDCRTTIVDTRPPTSLKTSTSLQPISQKLSENQATAACDAIKLQLYQTFEKQLVPEPGVSVIVSCIVK